MLIGCGLPISMDDPLRESMNMPYECGNQAMNWGGRREHEPGPEGYEKREDRME